MGEAGVIAHDEVLELKFRIELGGLVQHRLLCFRRRLLGSGIDNSGTLTLADSTVSNTSGSGIFNSGAATVINSTVSSNTGSGYGGDRGGRSTVQRERSP